MNNLPDRNGLTFFGAVTASISHELKNRFAIVNEQAGLLKDLVSMAERRGSHPDPERLVRLADSVKKQVALGDDLLRHMNRFAHSVDVPFGETDIAEVVACVVALARRNADRRQVSLDFQVPTPPPMVNTSAFFLMHLMWDLLHAAMGQGHPEHTLALSCEKTSEGAMIRIAGIGVDADLDKAISSASGLLENIGATVTVTSAPPAVCLVLPV